MNNIKETVDRLQADTERHLEEAWFGGEAKDLSKTLAREGCMAIQIDTIESLLSQVEVMRGALERANVLLRLLTVGQILQGGEDAIEASGINPWCVNEGRADRDDRWSPPWSSISPVSTLTTEKVTETPDYCYDAADWEYTHTWEDRGELMEAFKDRMEHGPFPIGCLKKLPSKYLADVPTEVGDDGDVLDSEWRWFDTLEEANAALSTTEKE